MRSRILDIVPKELHSGHIQESFALRILLMSQIVQILCHVKDATVRVAKIVGQDMGAVVEQGQFQPELMASCISVVVTVVVVALFQAGNGRIVGVGGPCQVQVHYSAGETEEVTADTQIVQDGRVPKLVGVGRQSMIVILFDR